VGWAWEAFEAWGHGCQTGLLPGCLLPGIHCRVDGSPAALVGEKDRRALSQQHGGKRELPLCARDVQRPLPAQILAVDVGAVLEQQTAGIDSAVLSSTVQRAVSEAVSALDRGARTEQQRGRALVVIGGRLVQGRRVEQVAAVGRRAAG